MAISTSRFNIRFSATGTNHLNNVRSTLRGIGQQSYITSNAVMRNMGNMERRTLSSLMGINSGILRVNNNFRRFGLAFGAGGALALAIGSMNLLNKAFIQTNSQMQSSIIMIEEMIGGKQSAMSYVNTMKDLSANFGADLNETMTSARGIMQVMKQIQTPQPKHLDKMMKMIMAVSAMDLENRGLSYTAFSFKEALQGQGTVDFRSLRNRLEINLGKATERAISNAVKKGDLDKALDLFDQGLKRIGIDSERLLNRLTKEGFLQNISRLNSYVTRGFQIMGEGIFKSMTLPLYKFNTFLANNFKDGSRGMQILKSASNFIVDTFGGIFRSLDAIGSEFYTNREGLLNNLSKLLKSFLNFGNSMRNNIGAFRDGILGITGLSTGEKVSKFITGLGTMAGFVDRIRNGFDRLREPIGAVGTAIGNLAVQIGNILSTTSGTGLISMLLYGVAGATQAVADIGSVVAYLRQATTLQTNPQGSMSTGDYVREGVNTLGSMAMIAGTIAMLRGGRGGRTSSNNALSRETINNPSIWARSRTQGETGFNTAYENEARLNRRIEIARESNRNIDTRRAINSTTMGNYNAFTAQANTHRTNVNSANSYLSMSNSTIKNLESKLSFERAKLGEFENELQKKKNLSSKAGVKNTDKQKRIDENIIAQKMKIKEYESKIANEKYTALGYESQLKYETQKMNESSKIASRYSNFRDPSLYRNVNVPNSPSFFQRAGSYFKAGFDEAGGFSNVIGTGANGLMIAQSAQQMGIFSRIGAFFSNGYQNINRFFGATLNASNELVSARTTLGSFVVALGVGVGAFNALKFNLENLFPSVFNPQRQENRANFEAQWQKDNVELMNAKKIQSFFVGRGFQPQKIASIFGGGWGGTNLAMGTAPTLNQFSAMYNNMPQSQKTQWSAFARQAKNWDDKTLERFGGNAKEIIRNWDAVIQGSLTISGFSAEGKRELQRLMQETMIKTAKASQVQGYIGDATVLDETEKIGIINNASNANINTQTNQRITQ